MKRKYNPITIIVLTYSQHQPVQFQLSKKFWKILAIIFVSIIYICISYPYICQRANRSRILEQELLEMEKHQQQIALENQGLKQSISQQEIQLRELAELSDQIQKEQEELYRREQVVREKLGLEEEKKEEVPSGLNDATLTVKQIKQNLLRSSREITGQVEEYGGYLDTIESGEYERQERQKAAEETRKRVVAYAKQFLGGAYVYGQNDPHTGVDCSGFTKYVLSHAAGISLTRTAASQSNEGIPTSSEMMKPGDLVFYGSDGFINHVALYIGNGQVIHASNEENGIMISPWNYREPVKIRNMIGE